MTVQDIPGQKKALDRAAILERFSQIVAKECNVPIEKLTPDAPLSDLGVASADVVLVLMVIEEEYNVYIPVDQSLSDVANFGQLANSVAELIEKLSQEKA